MATFSNNIFWLKNKLTRPESLRAYEEAVSYCNLQVSDRSSIDFQKRKDLVEYAYNHSPFYKSLYDKAGFRLSQLKAEKDWQLVPILEKQMIRDHADEIVSSEFDKATLCSITTGGSTGKPLKLYKSKHVHYEVLGWRALGWWGVSPADNEAIMHRRVPTTFKQKLMNRLMWWPTKRAYLSATAISDADIARFLADVEQNKIEWMVGYCASIEYVADYVLRNNITVEGIKLIWSTSSPLTKIVREKIERAFRCKVMDQYGCCEMGNIAIQKPNEDYLTINADYVHLDIVADGDRIVTNRKEYGDVLITDLNTKEFPLIKYRLGDKSRLVKTMEESEDGFPKLEFVQGRISDAVWLPNGTYVDGAFLTTICDNYSDYIACYQIHQQMDFSIDVSFIPKKDVEGTDVIIAKIVSDFIKLTNNQVEIRSKVVDSIPDFAGKRKFIISEISLDRLKNPKQYV